MRSRLARIHILVAAFAIAFFQNLGAADLGVIVASSHGSQLQVEAIDPFVLRLWIKPNGVLTREPSLALDSAALNRLPLTCATNAVATQVSTDALSVSIDRSTLAFSISETASRSELISRMTVTPVAQSDAWSLTRSLGVGERLFGLGQDNHNQGRLDRRGTVRELWAGQQINSGNVTAQYPVPLLIGLRADGRAYGLFFDNVHRMKFDLGARQPDELKVETDGGEIDVYVIGGPKIADVIERYTRLTGRPSLPPLWALGYWQSKCTYHDWAALDEAYQQLHTRGFPVDVMVLDYDWPEIANNFEWAKRWWVDGKTPQQKIAEYAARGVKIVTSQSGPMIRQESSTFTTGWAAGVFATDGNGNPVDAGYYGGKLLDFTHPKINDWLWPQVRARIRDGVAGWWLDLTEPEGEPPQAHYVGGRPANVHNEYSLRSTVSFEGAQLAENPDRRPFILTRSGSAGTQRHHAALWTGDIYSDYATLRAHPPEMLNSGLSGLAWWTSDSGGFMEGYYKNDQMGAHALLYERWMQFSAFAPITRAHKAGGLPEPYQYGPAVEQSSLHYLKRRYQLLPYIYTAAWEATRTGMPITRPLALAFQQDAKSVATPGDEYLFGPDLLVAPVLHEGRTNRRVYFPPGTWIDWDYGYEYEGGRDYLVAAPQSRIPVAVRAGAIIPLAPEMLSTSEKPWDPLTLEIFPSGRSQSTVYQDDGATFGYTRGEFTTTTFTCQETARDVTLTIREANKKFVPARYIARFHLHSTPRSVVARDGAKPEWSWSQENGVLSVTLPTDSGTVHSVRVALDGKAVPRREPPVLEEQKGNASNEAAASGGRPTPHFYPAPTLPVRLKAVNYDNGGEGVAFHRMTPAPANDLYRPDGLGIVEGTDVGGGFVLGKLRAGEWVRITVDAANGGWFDLTARVASEKGGGQIRMITLDQTIATIHVPSTGCDASWQDVSIPAVYLNPGITSLMLFVDQPEFLLNTLEFKPARTAPTKYPARLALRAGVCELLRTGGSEGDGAIRNFGRKGCSLTFGIVSCSVGEKSLRIKFQNGTDKYLPYSLQVGSRTPRPFELPPTAPNQWGSVDLKADLQAGANPVTIRGMVDGWDGVTIESLELVP